MERQSPYEERETREQGKKSRRYACSVKRQKYGNSFRRHSEIAYMLSATRECNFLQRRTNSLYPPLHAVM
eukprot:758653-Hanusia_phi.AAC.6